MEKAIVQLSNPPPPKPGSGSANSLSQAWERVRVHAHPKGFEKLTSSPIHSKIISNNLL